MRAPRVRPWGYASKSYHVNNIAKYKLTIAKWEKLWERQGGCCAICKVELAHPTERRMDKEGAEVFVDYVHIPNEARYASIPKQVRGLLCFNCNTYLGAIKESHIFLQNALAYLKLRGTSVFAEEVEGPKRAKEKEKKYYEVQTMNDEGQLQTYMVEYHD
jgi:hypothetical protein